MNKNVKPSKFQMILDWLAQPVPTTEKTIEEAEATSIMMKGYWEAIRGRDKQDIHQHVHLHGVNGESVEMVRIKQELDELEERKKELKRKMRGY